MPERLSLAARELANERRLDTRYTISRAKSLNRAVSKNVFLIISYRLQDTLAEVEFERDAVGVVHEQRPQLDHGHVVAGEFQAARLQLRAHSVIVRAFNRDVIDRATAIERGQFKGTGEAAKPVAYLAQRRLGILGVDRDQMQDRTVAGIVEPGAHAARAGKVAVLEFDHIGIERNRGVQIEGPNVAMV